MENTNFDASFSQCGLVNHHSQPYRSRTSNYGNEEGAEGEINEVFETEYAPFPQDESRLFAHGMHKASMRELSRLPEGEELFHSKTFKPYW